MGTLKTLAKVLVFFIIIPQLQELRAGDEVPYYPTDVKTTIDVGAINQNFRSLADDTDLLSIGDVPPKYQECIGNTIFCVDKHNKKIKLENVTIYISTTDGTVQGICFPDGTCQTSAGVGSVAIVSDAAQFTGDGTVGDPLTLLSSSITLQGNSFNSAGQLVLLDGAGNISGGINIEGGYASQNVLKSGDTMTGNLILNNADLIFSTGTYNVIINAGNQVSSFTYYLPPFNGKVGKGYVLNISTDGTMYWDAPSVSGVENYYFTNDTSDIGGHYVMYSSNTLSSVSTITYNSLSDGNTLLGRWVTNDGFPLTRDIVAGQWDIKIYGAKTSGNKNVRLYGVITIRKSGGEEIVISTTGYSGELQSTPQLYDLITSSTDIKLDDGDRVEVAGYAYVYGNGGSPDIEIYFGGTSPSNVAIPASNLTPQIVVLQNDVADLKTSTANLQSQIDSNDTDIYNLQVSTGDLQTEITSNDTDIANLESSTATLEANLNQEIADRQAADNAIATDTTTIAGNVSTNASDIDDLETSTATLEADKVPYSGATGEVDLGNYQLKTSSQLYISGAGAMGYNIATPAAGTIQLHGASCSKSLLFTNALEGNTINDGLRIYYDNALGAVIRNNESSYLRLYAGGSQILGLSSGGSIFGTDLDMNGNLITNATYYGDGSNLTGLTADQSANYNWTGVHTFQSSTTFNDVIGIGDGCGAPPCTTISDNGIIDTTELNTGNINASGSIYGDIQNTSGINSDIQSALGDKIDLTETSSVTFQNSDFSVGGSTFVVSGGKVGIGTNSPSYKLEVENGDVSINRPASGHTQLFLNSAVGYNDYISFKIGDVLKAQFLYWGDYGFRFYSNKNSKDLMLISDNGNVGIGTTSPSEKLDVKDGNIILSSSTYSGGIIFPDGTKQTSAAAGVGGSGTTGKIAKFTSANAVGDSIMTESGSNIDVAGGMTLSSSMTINANSSETYALTIDSNSDTSDGYVLSVSTSGYIRNKGQFSIASSTNLINSSSYTLTIPDWCDMIKINIFGAITSPQYYGIRYHLNGDTGNNYHGTILQSFVHTGVSWDTVNIDRGTTSNFFFFRDPFGSSYEINGEINIQNYRQNWHAIYSNIGAVSSDRYGSQIHNGGWYSTTKITSIVFDINSNFTGTLILNCLEIP